MRMRRVATAALIAMLVCGFSQARTLDQVPPYLEKEGKFVSYPALGIGALGAVIGTVISLPAVVVAAPIGWAAGDPLGYSLVPVSVVATGGAEVGYHVGGALPWLLKNGFYDAPMTAVARIKGEPASGLVAQVEPPPANRGDIQYLDTTPPAARVPVVLARQYSSALPPPKPPTSLMLRRQLSPFKPPPMPVKGAAPARKPVSVAPAALAPKPSFPPPAPPAAVAPPPLVSVPPVLAEPAPATVEPVAALPPAIVTPPPPVSAPPPVVVPPAVVVEPEPTPPVEVAAESSPASDDVSQEAGSDEASRPAIKKKKRKFSERFSF